MNRTLAQFAAPDGGGVAPHRLRGVLVASAAAGEQPQLFSEEIRAAFRSLR